MKKICAIVLSLLMLGMSTPLADTKDQTVGIATREDLMRIAENPGGSYQLTADIDMGGDFWTPIPFSGVLDGNGHTIGNLTVCETSDDRCKTYDVRRREFDTAFAGLFSIMTNAEVKHLRILNEKITIETDQNCFIGAIAGYTENCVISDCTVYMRGSLTSSGINAGVSGLVGYFVMSEVSDSTVEAELVFVDLDENTMCEAYLGGVYANGYGKISGCSVHTRGYANIYGYANNGGVVGMFKLPPRYEGKRLSIRDTNVDAEIRFFEVADSKRACCEPLIGENCGKDCYLANNDVQHFDFTYDDTAIPKYPEACEEPSYQIIVKEPTCTEWGYTTYICSKCGYSYRDDYTFPAHRYREESESATCTQEGHSYFTCEYCGDTYSTVIPAKGHTPGEWTVTVEPGPDKEGEECVFCMECGEALEKRKIPPTGKTETGTSEPEQTQEPERAELKSITIDEAVIEVYVGEYASMHMTVYPPEAAEYVRFESSDPSIVKVDYNGMLKGLYPGTATIRAYSQDGSIEATCTVMVSAVPQKEKETHSLFSWLRCG